MSSIQREQHVCSYLIFIVHSSSSTFISNLITHNQTVCLAILCVRINRSISFVMLDKLMLIRCSILLYSDDRVVMRPKRWIVQFRLFFSRNFWDYKAISQFILWLQPQIKYKTIFKCIKIIYHIWNLLPKDFFSLVALSFIKCSELGTTLNGRIGTANIMI